MQPNGTCVPCLLSYNQQNKTKHKTIVLRAHTAHSAHRTLTSQSKQERVVINTVIYCRKRKSQKVKRKRAIRMSDDAL